MTKHRVLRCVATTLLLASVLLISAAQPDDPMTRPAATRADSDSFRRYWLMIGIPGIILGAGAFVVVAMLANRARRGKLERGELPEMPE